MTSTHHTPKTAAVTAVAAWALAAQPVTVTGDIPESYTSLAAVLGEAGRASVRQAGPTQTPTEANHEPHAQDDDTPPALRRAALVRCAVGLLLGAAILATAAWAVYALNGGVWPDVGHLAVPIGDPIAGRPY